MSLWERLKRGDEPERPERPERRADARRRQRLIDGFVSSERVPAQPCKVCNISATGSKLELWRRDSKPPLLVGERVTLNIPSDRREIDGEIVWRKETAMGLRFTSDYRTLRRPHRKSRTRPSAVEKA